jgi:hypothetical protein
MHLISCDILLPDFLGNIHNEHVTTQNVFFILDALFNKNTHALTNFSLLKAASLGSIASNVWWTCELREFRWVSTSLQSSSNRSAISCLHAALS